jgi:hypothetical protein
MALSAVSGVERRVYDERRTMMQEEFASGIHKRPVIVYEKDVRHVYFHCRLSRHFLFPSRQCGPNAMPARSH